MDTRLQTIASYVPTMIVRQVMTSPAPPESPVEESVPAALLFADFSGFTELTEHLSQTHHGPDSAEELSNVLNRAFDEVITPILALGGDVVTFAGDALLALWPATDEHLTTMVQRAAQCALILQMLFQEERLASQVRLGVRMGIGVGEVVLSCVGGVYERWVWLVRGEAVSQVMQAEQQAHPGQVVLAPEAWELVKTACAGRLVGEEGGGREEGAEGQKGKETASHARGILLEEVLQPVPLRFPSPPVIGPALEEALRGYVPDAVLTRLAAGQGGWLAELRLVTVIFINLPDIFEASASPAPPAPPAPVASPASSAAPSPSLTLDQVQKSICALQTALYRYEGSVNKISVDEKGTILIGVFGLPPLAHEDDAARGVQAALVARSELQALGMRCAIGVTTGQAFCGVIGSDQRREYTILGDVVNLAARLMQQAASDDEAILCDGPTCTAAQPRLVFDALPPVVVKGRSEPVDIYRPLRQEQHMMRSPEVLIGRVRERTFLTARLQTLRRGGGGRRNRREPSVLLIEGEAGIGKSRLLDDARRNAETLGIAMLEGGGEAIEQTTPYYPWRHIFTRVLGLEALSDLAQQRQHLLEALASEPSMLRQLSLLNAVLPLELPEDERMMPQRTGQALADATRTFLLQVLQVRLAHQPTLLMMDSADWLDSASWALLLDVSYKMPSVLVVVAMRPPDGSFPESYHRIAQSPHTHRMVLEPLSFDETVALVCQRLAVTRIPDSVASLIYEKSQGNPFFVEELSYALRDSEQLIIRDGVGWVAPNASDLTALRLPDTLQSVIISRIDRLVPAQQLTLKVASVIGYTFPYGLLRDVYPLEAERDDLPDHLSDLAKRGLVYFKSTAPEPGYRFRHIITQEAVYHMMPLAQRRQVHGAVAEWYVRTYPDRLDEHATLLAQHFALADDARAQKYYTLAGNVAFRIHANMEAIAHFRRALEIAHRHDAISEHFQYLYTQRGHILELEGEGEAALENYREMEHLADERQDCELKLAALMSLASLRSTPNPTFDPQQGADLLDQALTLAREMENRAAECRILWNKMVLQVFTGDDAHQAIAYGEQSLHLARALNLRKQAALTLNDLALAYRNSGQLAHSQHVLDEARGLIRELDHMPMLADNLSRYSLGHFLMGSYDEAITAAEEANQISQFIGNMASQSASKAMVGQVYLEQGQPDRAIAIMTEAVYLGEQVGNLAVQIGTRADLGWVYATLGAFDHALVLAELAYARSEEHNHIFLPWVLAVLARIYLRIGDVERAEAAISEGYQSFKGRGEMLLPPVYMGLADAELSLAMHRYDEAIAAAERVLTYLHQYQIRPFAADALYLKGRALLALEDGEAAHAALREAQTRTTSPPSQRIRWPVLFLLSYLETRRRNADTARTLRHQARQIVLSIADHTGDPELRESFLSLPEVLVVVGGGPVQKPKGNEPLV